MDKKGLLAIIISLTIWVGWQKFYWEPHQRQIIEQQRVAEKARLDSLPKAAPTAVAAIAVPKAAKAPVVRKEAAPAVTRELVNSQIKLRFTNGPHLIDGGMLSGYKNEAGEQGVSMEYITGFSRQLRLRVNEAGYEPLAELNWQQAAGAGGAITQQLVLPQGEFTREATLAPNGYYFDLTYRVRFKNTPPRFLFVDMFGSPARKNDKEGSILGQAPDKVHLAYRDTQGRESPMASALTAAHERNTGVKWLGVDTKYFALAAAPAKELRSDSGVQASPVFVAGVPAVMQSFVVPTGGKQDVTVSLRVYFGPKQLELLKAADPILTDTIDFGWTSFLALPLLQGLKWLYLYLKNYGLAIIVLTAAIKVLLYPLTYKSMESMAKMSKLQPQLNALREKYKDDKDKLNTEMMSFMKTHGYNPVGGCLPMLLQMPIFFALYRVFFNSMELYQAPFGLWIHDLSSPDRFLITPFLLTGLMYLQQKLSPSTAMDPTQQRVLQLMPVMFGVFMLMLPAGLNIYMLVNSMVSIAQQYYLNRKFGVGKFAKA